MEIEDSLRPNDALATCQVAEHDIVFLLDFPCVQDRHLPRVDALETDMVDPDETLGILHPAHQSEGARSQPLFHPGAMDLSTDLHPSARAALDDRGGAVPALRLPCRTLTDHGRRLLNGELARPPGDPRHHPGFVSGRGLALMLEQGSRERIEAAGGVSRPFLRLQLEALHLLSFGSETGLAIVWLRVVPDGALVLAHVEEALHILANATRKGSLGWACEAEPAGRFNLLTLVEGILGPAGCSAAPWSRLFTLTYVQLEEVSESDELAGDMLATAAWRLSRHYTTAYRPGPDYLAGTLLSRPFAGVVHAASMEGVASVTVPEEIFLRKGFAARVRTCYLPLAVLAFHEHVQLLDMARRAAGALAGAVPITPGGIARAEALRRLIDAFLSFRLRYRLPVVSDITMHNQFYAALRAGLQVEALTQKLSGDTADAARALQEGHARAAASRSHAQHSAHLRRERGRAWVLGVFAGLLTFLTSLAALKEVREALLHHVHGPDWLDDPAWPAAAAALLGLLSGIVTFVRHRDSHANGVEAEDEIDQELQADLTGEAVHVAGDGAGMQPVAAGVAAAVAQDRS